MHRSPPILLPCLLPLSLLLFLVSIIFIAIINTNDCYSIISARSTIITTITITVIIMNFIIPIVVVIIISVLIPTTTTTSAPSAWQEGYPRALLTRVDSQPTPGAYFPGQLRCGRPICGPAAREADLSFAFWLSDRARNRLGPKRLRHRWPNPSTYFISIMYTCACELANERVRTCVENVSSNLKKRNKNRKSKISMSYSTKIPTSSEWGEGDSD